MAANFRALRVLVVDDDVLIRWSIAAILAHAGHTVLEAADGAAAIRALQTGGEDIDAILLDYRLPDSDNLLLLATIRRLVPRSIVILMTAFGTADVATEAIGMGACHILHKPFEMGDLDLLLQRACEWRGC
jgi:DNA-binding NtrC family response regulator